MGSKALELLAPARDADTAIAAINHGADAVYIGAPSFGARAAATNTLDDIRRVVEAAHPFGVRVYVTMNTIIFENELEEVKSLVDRLYDIGVDALIVQDMAYTALDIPAIDLHASTQCNARTPEKVAMLARCGFSQIVIPREFTIEQIRQAAEAAIPEGSRIEVFVHGALCVSYSGDCQAGYVLSRRSANRGECPQICRQVFTLTDASGRPVRTLPDGKGATRHWLSLADLNRLDYLKELADAGASSFKIEGRLKPTSYVKNVTAAYSLALDHIVESEPERYRRSSYGKTTLNFTPDTTRSFNRGFTRLFLTDPRQRNITSWTSPKWTGRKVAVVKQIKGNCITVSMTEEIHNGDGLGWFDKSDKFCGFRVNRVEGDRIYPAPGSTLPSDSGTVLYRNNDTAFEALLSRADSGRRTIGVDMTVRPLPDGRIAIDVTDERGMRVSICSSREYTDKARTAQENPRRNILSRLGDTVYRLDSLDDCLGDIFIPAAELTALRRQALDSLDRAWRISRRPAKRKGATQSEKSLSGHVTTYHDNIANTLARRFYTEHGAKVAEEAIECKIPQGDVQVMCTRYCLRRELGACLKTTGKSALPDSLYLTSGSIRLKLNFDCASCQMRITTSRT